MAYVLPPDKCDRGVGLWCGAVAFMQYGPRNLRWPMGNARRAAVGRAITLGSMDDTLLVDVAFSFGDYFRRCHIQRALLRRG